MTLHEPLSVTHQAEYFDGTSALSHQVVVSPQKSDLLVTHAETDEILARWPLFETHWISGDEQPVLSTGKFPNARLILRHKSLAEELIRRFPALRGPVKSARSHKTHRMAWRYGLAAVALVVAIFLAVPWLSGPLARLATEEWRQNLGQQSSRQIARFLGPTCNDPRGQVALTALAQKLVQQLPVPEAINVTVVDHDMINAFALPGGQVRFVKGLIKAADGPDEVAGVLAHEIAHVVYRHPEEQTFRQLGYDILLSSFGDSGAVTEIAASTGVYLVSAAYSREAESAADALAMELLEKANISRQGMVSFFQRVQKMEGETSDLLEYLSTHPATGERKQAAEASTGGGKPALTDKSWQALKSICD